jgi:hypothetical protein
VDVLLKNPNVKTVFLLVSDNLKKFDLTAIALIAKFGREIEIFDYSAI